MWTSSRPPLSLILLSAASVLTVLSPPVLAARGILTYDKIRQTNGPIVLAEIIEVKEVSRPAPNDAGRTDQGYAISLKVHEVLRGDLKAKTIQIPFSPKGYSRTWEFDDRPKNGMKVLAFLKSGQDDQWDDFGLPDTIRVVDTFDAAVVKTFRLILDFWAITPESKQEKALRAGCLGDDLGFRLYCVGVLGDRAWHQESEAPEVLSFLWEMYQTPASISTPGSCATARSGTSFAAWGGRRTSRGTQSCASWWSGPGKTRTRARASPSTMPCCP